MALKELRAPRPPVHIGTAGWSVRRDIAPEAHPLQSGLERYAAHFDCVEINATFYRLPRLSTVERWRDSTPESFRFTVKMPQSITHEARLVGARAELRAFCQLVTGFGSKLGPLLVQLPPSLAFDVRAAGRFFRELASLHAGPVVVEPRHTTWFTERAETLLAQHAIGRVAADPARCPAAAEPTAAGHVAYFRWHGSPRMYFSAYEPDALATLAERLRHLHTVDGTRSLFCIFDNTGLGAAAVNAMQLRALL